MKIPHWKNGKTGRTEVDPSFLGEKVMSRTVHAAVVMYQANKRTGTHKTKTRSEISRTKSAVFRQKGLGKARVRHPQVSQCRGGGVAHGPRPRDYSYAMPRKARRAALRSALLSKFRDGQVVLADALEFGAPKTKELVSVLGSLGAQGSCLIVDGAPAKNLVLSARNISRVKVTSAQDLNALDVIQHRHLLVTQAGLDAMKEVHGG
jgi:large subunit ribosomal protein L4